MKYIIKNPEPQKLLEWKAQDKMYQRGNPKYDRITGETQITLATSLRSEQGNICCYCERTLAEGDYHVEHLKPQGILAYKQFCCDYDNMVCSCQQNLIKGEPNHCGMSKASWYQEDLFISPLSPDCETKFEYTVDGQILPADVADQAAITTIDKCKLALPKLKSLRERVIETFLDDSLSDFELAAYVQGYLVRKEDNNDVYNPFYTTIQFLFGHLAQNN